MSEQKIAYRFLFAGGGTGGHLYPAIAVAQSLNELEKSDITFVGTRNKIEGRVIPELGYKFKSIWISGLNRKLTFKNLLFPFKLLVSVIQSLWISFRFKPEVAIGTGAYVSGPALWGASIMGARLVLMEQNSYPGLTNRLLEKKAEKIFVSFEESKKYFRDPDKVENSGNPVRNSIKLHSREHALSKFELNDYKKTLVIVGGSLGARSINSAIANNLDDLKQLGIQIIWQTGDFYFEDYKKLNDSQVKVRKYFDDISIAYSAADLLLVRAGATTIAEVASIGLPVIFVPSPNVADDHQTKNAIVISDANAAVLIKDMELEEKIVITIQDLIFDNIRLEQFSINIRSFAKPNASEMVAKEILKIASRNQRIE